MRPSTGIRVGDAGHKGRGVFATKQFYPGDLIERAPLLIIEDYVDLIDTGIEEYWYDAGDDSCAVGLGYASLYNHSLRPNADYTIRTDEGIIDITAAREIRPKTEITINYTGDPESHRKLKFTRRPSGGEPEEPTKKSKRKKREIFHYIDASWGEDDVWVWCGTYDVAWTSIPGLVTCKKCKKFMLQEREKLRQWSPEMAEPVPRHTLLRLLGDIRDVCANGDNQYYAEVLREAIRVMTGRRR